MTISVLLLTAAFDRKRLTDGKTRVHVIIGYFVRKYSVWSTRTCSPRFGSRTPVVSSKLRYKRDSSFILEDQCTYPSSLITTPIFVRKRLRHVTRLQLKFHGPYNNRLIIWPNRWCNLLGSLFFLFFF